jgi:leader peptidase (prepilin peptidase)/N-methyltransferase
MAGAPGSFSHRLWRSKVVEVSVIGVVALGAVAASMAAAPGWSGGAGAVLAGLMVAIAVVDYHLMIIPNELNALAFISGLVAAGIEPKGAPIAAIIQAIIRAGLTFALFFAFRASYQKLRGVEGMGFGDVKLAAVAGVWLDWADLPIAVNIAAIAALGAAVYARLRGKVFDGKSRLPFGAFFAPAVWTCWLLAAWRGS